LGSSLSPFATLSMRSAGLGMLPIGSVGMSDAGADDLDSVAHALQPDFFFLVRDDHPPGVRIARSHDPSEADVTAGERLQLERYVLEDVWEMRSFSQPLQKSTRFLPGTVVLGQCWQRMGQTFTKSGDVCGANLLEAPELHVTGNDRSEAPVIRAPQRADPGYFQFVRVDLWLCCGSHLVVEVGMAKNATAAPQRHGPIIALSRIASPNPDRFELIPSSRPSGVHQPRSQNV